MDGGLLDRGYNINGSASNQRRQRSDTRPTSATKFQLETGKQGLEMRFQLAHELPRVSRDGSTLVDGSLDPASSGFSGLSG